MKKFWIVIGETGVNKIPDRVINKDKTGGEDVFNFPMELQAIKVAERMAVKYPGEEYYVMESVKCSKAEIKASTSG